MRLPSYVVLFNSIVLIAGCVDSGTADTPLAPGVVPAHTVESARIREQASLDELTRLVALAMRDTGIRQRVRNDLRNSRHTREHKLHLASYLQGESGGILLAKITKESGRTREEVLALMARIRPLEFYMPVPEHRSAWQGGSDLIVANLLDEKLDGVPNTPVGYDLSGNRVALSAETPPAIPTLALVPVETDFTAPLDSLPRDGDAVTGSRLGISMADLQSDADGGAHTVPVSNPPGLYMTFSYLKNDGEAWIKGDPEIEVHIHGPAPGSGDRTKADDLSCAGERQPSPRRFNQDSRSWNGSVLLFTRDEIEQYNVENMDGFNVLFWEDDDTACVVKTDKSLVDLLGAGAVGVALGPSVFVGGCTLLGCAMGGGLFLAGAYHLASFLKTNDDYLGAAMITTGSQYTYPDANLVILNGTEVNGRAMLVVRP